MPSTTVPQNPLLSATLLERHDLVSVCEIKDRDPRVADLGIHNGVVAFCLTVENDPLSAVQVPDDGALELCGGLNLQDTQSAQATNRLLELMKSVLEWGRAPVKTLPMNRKSVDAISIFRKSLPSCEDLRFNSNAYCNLL